MIEQFVCKIDVIQTILTVMSTV